MTSTTGPWWFNGNTTTTAATGNYTVDWSNVIGSNLHIQQAVTNSRIAPPSEEERRGKIEGAWVAQDLYMADRNADFMMANEHAMRVVLFITKESICPCGLEPLTVLCFSMRQWLCASSLYHPIEDEWEELLYTYPQAQEELDSLDI